MKKLFATTFLLSAVMASAAHAYPKDFSGPFVMGSLGGNYATVGASAFTVGGAPLPSGTTTNNGGGLSGGIAGGYLHKISKSFPLHVGGKLGTTLSNASGSEKTTGMMGGNSTTAKHKFSSPHALQGAALIGYPITDTIMPFVLIGWENALWKHKVTTDMAGTGTAKSSKRQNALLVGAGAVKKVSQNASVGMMYEGSFHFDKQKSNGGGVTADHKGAQNHKFMTVVMWTFK